MFYCDECRVAKGWPDGIVKSQGNCEICNRPAICNNVPSSHLTSSKVDTIDDMLADKQDPEEIANFHGIDKGVVEALDTFFSHGYDGGSFVTALLAQDYKEALLHAHEHLTRRSIIKHMEYAKELMDKHGYDPIFATATSLGFKIGKVYRRIDDSRCTYHIVCDTHYTAVFVDGSEEPSVDTIDILGSRDDYEVLRCRE